MEGSAPGRKDHPCSVGGRKSRGGEGWYGEDVEEGEIHEEIKAEDDEDAADHGAGKMTGGIGVFLGEVDCLVPTVVGDHDHADGCDGGNDSLKEACEVVREDGSGAWRDGAA